MSWEYDNDEQFWMKARPNSGQVPAYATPAELENRIVEALNWYHSHPLKEGVAFHSRGVVTKTFVSKMRPFTFKGVALALGLTENGLLNYAKKDGFAPVIEWLRDVIYTQKFEGAATGLLNPVIISRDLGLADKSEVSGPNGRPIEVNELSALELLTSRIAGVASRGGETGVSEGTD